MGIEKAKTAKEINAELKRKRNPAAEEPEIKESDAPTSDADNESPGSDQSGKEAEGAESPNNDGSDLDPEEKKIVPGAESA